jgi:mevalonate kinase
MNVTVTEVVHRLKRLSYDLNTLQNRTISILFDILYDVNFNAKPVSRNVIMYLEENREFMRRLLEDMDVIVKRLKTAIEQKEE